MRVNQQNKPKNYCIDCKFYSPIKWSFWTKIKNLFRKQLRLGICSNNTYKKFSAKQLGINGKDLKVFPDWNCAEFERKI